MKQKFLERAQELAKLNELVVETKTFYNKLNFVYKNKKLEIPSYAWKSKQVKWDEIILGMFSMLLASQTDDEIFVYDPKAYLDLFEDVTEQRNKN